MCAQEHFADVRHHAVMSARNALGQWWEQELGAEWWEILADPGTRADALWRASGAMVLAVEPIMEPLPSTQVQCSELQRERDFYAGQFEALRDQLGRLLAERDGQAEQRRALALTAGQAPAWSSGRVFGDQG
jgi:hypothetical protein